MAPWENHDEELRQGVEPTWVQLRPYSGQPENAKVSKDLMDVLFGYPLEVLQVLGDPLKGRMYKISAEATVAPMELTFHEDVLMSADPPLYRMPRGTLSIDSEELGAPTVKQTPPKTQTKDPIDDIHAPGAKADSGKPPVGMIFEYFPRALLEVARVAGFGAQKYTRGGWVSVPDGEHRYDDALGRHLLERHVSGSTDPESGLPHLAHAAWNALAILELKLRGEEQ